MSTNRRRKILVSMPTEQYAERMKLEGVLQYAHEKSGERWDVSLDLGDEIRTPPDGIIAYITSDAQRRRVLDMNLPTVLIEDLLTPTTFPRRRNVVTLLCDHYAEGVTAAKYFLSRHFKNFAFIGTSASWSRRRGSGFRTTIEQAGYRCRSIGISDIANLPHPSAIFAAHDILGRRVLSAIGDLGLSIPDELAVLGVDDDEVMCTTSAPTLSSIPTFDRSLGYAAGRALNEVLLKRAKGRVIRTHHNRVITRFSTSRDAIDDPFVARALNAIRGNMTAKLDADSLAQRINYSKRSLQQRFERTLGISLSEAVRRTRINTAKDMLANGRESVAAIAEHCGFASTSHLARCLKADVGLTPLAFRKRRLKQI